MEKKKIINLIGGIIIVIILMITACVVTYKITTETAFKEGYETGVGTLKEPVSGKVYKAILVGMEVNSGECASLSFFFQDQVQLINKTVVYIDGKIKLVN